MVAIRVDYSQNRWGRVGGAGQGSVAGGAREGVCRCKMVGRGNHFEGYPTKHRHHPIVTPPAHQCNPQ